MKPLKTSPIKIIAPSDAITASLKPDEQIWFRQRTYIKMAVFIASFIYVALILILITT